MERKVCLRTIALYRSGARSDGFVSLFLIHKKRNVISKRCYPFWFYIDRFYVCFFVYIEYLTLIILKLFPLLVHCWSHIETGSSIENMWALSVGVMVVSRTIRLYFTFRYRFLNMKKNPKCLKFNLPTFSFD